MARSNGTSNGIQPWHPTMAPSNGTPAMAPSNGTEQWHPSNGTEQWRPAMAPNVNSARVGSWHPAMAPSNGIQPLPPQWRPAMAPQHGTHCMAPRQWHPSMAPTNGTQQWQSHPAWHPAMVQQWHHVQTVKVCQTTPALAPSNGTLLASINGAQQWQPATAPRPIRQRVHPPPPYPQQWQPSNGAQQWQPSNGSPAMAPSNGSQQQHHVQSANVYTHPPYPQQWQPATAPRPIFELVHQPPLLLEVRTPIAKAIWGNSGKWRCLFRKFGRAKKIWCQVSWEGGQPKYWSCPTPKPVKRCETPVMYGVRRSAHMAGKRRKVFFFMFTRLMVVCSNSNSFRFVLHCHWVLNAQLFLNSLALLPWTPKANRFLAGDVENHVFPLSAELCLDMSHMAAMEKLHMEFGHLKLT